jgi:hypothetical protein
VETTTKHVSRMLRYLYDQLDIGYGGYGFGAFVFLAVQRVFYAVQRNSTTSRNNFRWTETGDENGAGVTNRTHGSERLSIDCWV